jgi:hypothetical protein
MELKKKMNMTLKDYLDFNYRYMRKRTIIIPVAAVVILTVVISIIGIVKLGSGWTRVFSSELIIYYVILLLIPFASILTVRIVAKKQYESNKLIKSETEIVINKAGVSETSKYGNTSAEWADLYKIEEAKSAYYFYIAKGQAFILPKRILDNDEDTAVRELISKYMAPGENKLSKQH